MFFTFIILYHVRLVTYDSRFRIPLNKRLPVPREVKSEVDMRCTEWEVVTNLVRAKTWHQVWPDVTDEG